MALNFSDITGAIAAFQEVVSLFSQMKADGSFDKIKAAVSTAESELHSPAAVALIAKVESYFHTAEAPAAAVAAAPVEGKA